MALTQGDVETAVSTQMGNITHKGKATATGDGTTLLFSIAPHGYYLVEDTVSCTVNDATVTAFTVDEDNGYVEFDSAPADESDIVWWFDYVAYPDSFITEAVNAAVYSLYPYFYVKDNEEITTDGESLEYDLAAGEEVTSVFWRASTSDQWQRLPKRSKWTVFLDDGTLWVRFYKAPSTGTARVHYIARCDITQLPDRAETAIVSYACYHLIVQKYPQRVRSDVAIATQGNGTLSPRQMNDAAQAFYLRYQLQLMQLRMKPWSQY